MKPRRMKTHKILRESQSASPVVKATVVISSNKDAYVYPKNIQKGNRRESIVQKIEKT